MAPATERAGNPNSPKPASWVVTAAAVGATATAQDRDRRADRDRDRGRVDFRWEKSLPNGSNVHVHDVNATILRLIGMDHTRLTYLYQSRDMRLTDVHGDNEFTKQLVG